MRFRLVTMLVAVVALAPIAACGDGINKNAYVKDVSSIQQATQTEGGEIGSEFSKSKSTQKMGARLLELSAVLDKGADRMAAVSAPGSVKADHRRIVQLYRDHSQDLKDLATRLPNSSSKELKAILEDINKALAELATDEQQIVDRINTTLQG